MALSLWNMLYEIEIKQDSGTIPYYCQVIYVKKDPKHKKSFIGEVTFVQETFFVLALISSF